MDVLRRALREFVGLYWESGLGSDVPALAWYLLASLAPLALGLTALVSVVLGDYAQAQALASRATRVLPKDVHDQIVQLILRTKHDSPLLIAGAIVGMLWTSSGAVGVIGRCLSRLLARPESNPVLGKLRAIAVAAAVALLIVLLVIVGSAGTGLVHRLDANVVLVRIAVPIAALALIALICAATYRGLAGESVAWRAAVTGGAVSGVALLVTPTAAGYYMRYVAGSAPVELFLLLAGVLITCWLIALGLLLGVGTTARVQLGHRLRAPS